MSAMVTVFLKEVRENLRDRKTVFNSLLMGPIMGPLLFVVMMSVILNRELDRAEQPLKLPVIGAEQAPNLVGFLRQQGVQVLPPPADAEAAVKAQEFDVVLRIPAEFPQAWAKGESAPVELVYDASQRDANRPRERAKDLIEAYGRQVSALRLLARGVHPLVTRPVAVVERDQSSAAARAGQIMAFLPYVLMIGAFIGGMYLAIDTTAGERERRSLEPLLATPNSASSIMLGKLSATTSFALASLVLTLIAFALLVPRLPLDKLGFQLDFGLVTALKVLLLCAPVVLFASALQTLVAAYAKSFREAQSYLQLILFVPMIPSIAVMIVPLKTELWMMATPLLAQNLAINKLVRGEAVPTLHFALAIGVMLVLALVITAITAQVYKREQLAAST